MKRLLLGMALACLWRPVLAAPPEVITDIAPVQSLVAQVMGDLGQPVTLLPPGASAHDYALRPSQMAALGRARLMIWIGPALTPWLDGPIAAQDPALEQLVLMDLPVTQRRPFREGVDLGAFAGADGGHDHDHDHDHGHDHGHEGDDHRDAADRPDPHAWLDPQNASAWVAEIAETLAAMDSENAQTYRENAARSQAALAALDAEIAARLAPVRGKGFVMMHDALGYFEARFDLQASAAVNASDDRAAGPARMSALHDILQEGGIVCAFSEPGAQEQALARVIAGSGLRQGRLDFLGSGLPEGPELYFGMMRDLAEALETCLTPA